MKILRSAGDTKKSGWSFSFETLKAIESGLTERGWPVELEEINEMLEVLDENHLLRVTKQHNSIGEDGE